MNEAEQKHSLTVRSGSWLHGDAVPHEVLIVRDIEAAREVFYVQFCKDGAIESTSVGFNTLVEAIAYAEANVDGPIHWDGASQQL